MLRKIALLIGAVFCTALSGCAEKLEELAGSRPEAEFLPAEESAQRPFYEQLSEKEKAVYTALYNGIAAGEEKIPLPYKVDEETYAKLYHLLEKQESALFYIDSVYYTAPEIEEAQIEYRSVDDKDEMTAALEAKKGEILSEISVSADDFEKALYIHDYLVQNCRYELDGSEYNATSYGCLVNGTAHCEGYAKAFDYLAKGAGLRSIIVTGISNEGINHAWNQVEIGGVWYNLDVTWDDTDKDEAPRHVFFLCEDENFVKTHTEDGGWFEAFDCDENKDTYYIRQDLMIENFDDAERIVRRELEAEKEALELKFSDSAVYDDFLQTYLEEQEIFSLIEESGWEIPETGMTITLTEHETENCMEISLK
ncbi:MAG: hypothetical protein IJX77_02970 [Ruminococcus sp.]|nr:hypothetical protein [Ruminococcus sp.]